MDIVWSAWRIEDVELAKKHRFTVEEFHKMGESGIFSEDDRVELVEGEIVEMTPIGWRHARVVTSLTTILASNFGHLCDVSVQNPLTLGDHGEHQPDLALLEKTHPADRAPRAEDALLVIEVSDTSLRYDLEVKLPLYAPAGVREVWILDLSHDVVRAHAGTSAGGYETVREYRRGDYVAQALPLEEEIVLSVDEILA